MSKPILAVAALLGCAPAMAQEPSAPAAAPVAGPVAEPGEDEDSLELNLLEELPIEVRRKGRELVFVLTEPWTEAELTIGGCTSWSETYPAYRAGRELKFKIDAKKTCDVSLAFARPDKSGVEVNFSLDPE